MGALVSCMSNLMYISEKITSYTAFTVLVCCLVLTITMTLGLGIGLGYNYCFVDMRTKYKYIKGHYIYPGNPRWPYKGEEHTTEEPKLKDIAENDVLRKQPYKTEDISFLPDIIMTPARLLEKPRFKITSVDDENTNYYHPMIPNAESYYGIEASVKTIAEEAITDATTVVSEDVDETSSTTSTNIPKSSTTISTNFYESSSTTASIIEATTEIKDESSEASPKVTTLKDSSSRKVKKLVIPITGLDLISLLSKLSAENKNYSLQVVTT